MRHTGYTVSTNPVTRTTSVTIHLKDYGDVRAEYVQDNVHIKLPTSCDLTLCFQTATALKDLKARLLLHSALDDLVQELDIDDENRLERETWEAKGEWYKEK